LPDADVIIEAAQRPVRLQNLFVPAAAGDLENYFKKRSAL
jgi:hypothetical protein